MILSPMRFKNFVWPHNPRVYSITYERKIAVHKIPFGRHYLQSLGQTRRQLRGDGQFVDSRTYHTFKERANMFNEEKSGVQDHPVWNTTTAWFAGLELRQEPRRDYVAYSFEFWEVMSNGNTTELTTAAVSGGTQTGGNAQGEWHTVVWGDTLWGLSRRYGEPLNSIIALNPQIRNPNLIYPGQRVRIR